MRLTAILVLACAARGLAQPRYILLPISEQSRGHGTDSLPAIWRPYLAELLQASHRPDSPVP